MGDDAHEAVALGEAGEDPDGLLKALVVQRAEAFIEEEGVQPDAARRALDLVREAQSQRQGGFEALAAREGLDAAAGAVVVVDDAEVEAGLAALVLGTHPLQLVLPGGHLHKAGVGVDEDGVEVVHLDVSLEAYLLFAAEGAARRGGKGVHPLPAAFQLCPGGGVLTVEVSGLPVGQEAGRQGLFLSRESGAPGRQGVPLGFEWAVERGLYSVCITDHMDADYPPDDEMGESAFRLDTENYFPFLLKKKKEYEERIQVRIGIELGLQKHLGTRYETLIEKYPFDFVIGSMHLVCGEDPYTGKVFEELGDAQVYRRMFCETLECIRKIKCFDVLGHLDYVVRYGKHQAEAYSYEKFSDEIDMILRELISSGKGLELNMAGIKYGLGFAHPHPSVLRRYKELGGEIITVGSDAHKAEHIGYEFEIAGELLKSCGFRYYTEFENRKAVFRRIP